MRMVNPLTLVTQLLRVDKTAGAKPPALELEEFETLLEPLKDGLYGFIFKSMGFSEEAGDVYQETVLRAFKYRKKFQRERSFKTWIFSIANNEVKRHYQKRSGTVFMDRTSPFPAEATEVSATRERVRDVFAAASTLTERQKRIFFLFYESEFPVREIARIMGLTENNIKVTLNQCRNRIRSHLGVTDGK